MNDPSLPLGTRRILELAACSMLDAHASEGVLLVDRDAREVWTDDHCRRLLPALGFERVEDRLPCAATHCGRRGRTPAYPSRRLR